MRTEDICVLVLFLIGHVSYFLFFFLRNDFFVSQRRYVINVLSEYMHQKKNAFSQGIKWKRRLKQCCINDTKNLKPLKGAKSTSDEKSTSLWKKRTAYHTNYFICQKCLIQLIIFSKMNLHTGDFRYIGSVF